MSVQNKKRQLVTVPVAANDRAVIVCPSCGARSRFNVSKFRGRTLPLPLTCKCGTPFLCSLQFPAPVPQKQARSAKGASPDDTDIPIVDIASEISAKKKSASAAPQTPGTTSEIDTPAKEHSVREKDTNADSSIRTSYVDSKGRADIICPYCDLTKTVVINHVHALGKAVPVKCKCGQSFSCRFVPKDRVKASGQTNVYFSKINGELPGINPLIFHIDSQGEAMIMCPACSNFKKVKPDTDETLNGLCIFTCQCGSTFPFKIDFRRAFRKPVNLRGTYYNLRQKVKGELFVKNVSFGGIGIYVEGEALDGVHGFKTGDLLEVSFRLDDAKRSEINRRVEVRTINGPTVGCRFADSLAHDKELGFYLMP